MSHQIIGGGGAAIKSIQSGTIDLNGVNSNTATITSVDPNNSLIFWNGSSGASASTSPSIYNNRAELTNATTVTAFHGANDANAMPVAFTVVEFYPGTIKSVQRGTINTNGGTSATATITSVNTAKAVVTFLGVESNFGGAGVATNNDKVVLTNATTVTASNGQNPGGTNKVGYQVVEFY